MRILPTRYRYPIFFVGLVMMALSGFIQKYAGTGLGLTIALVSVGFVLFVASLALP